jgi:carboxymethylenebutenolidase
MNGLRGVHGLLLPLVLIAGACQRTGAAVDEHAGHEMDSASTARGGDVAAVSGSQALIPPGNADAMARLSASPRHGEWVMIPDGAANDSVRAWVVYPERSTRAPVVIVVQEIFGLTPWIRSVADQLAADGYIGVAPDFLTGKGVSGNPVDGPDSQAATAAVRALDGAEVQRRIDAVARYANALPSASGKYGIVGFCWGGSVSFNHAARTPGPNASVVYYGSSPEVPVLMNVRAPVLGLYGSDDARVNATIARADSTLRATGRTFEQHIFEGAGHGFLRQQDGRDGANLEAARRAWPLTIGFFRQHLE